MIDAILSFLLDAILSILLWFITKLSGKIKFIKKRILSKEEKELLVAAAQGSEFYIISETGCGQFVQVGDKDFNDNPAIIATYIEALESLRKKGYVSRKSNTYYRLTSSGWEKAEKLAKKSGNG
ncbi:hypothetical protein ACFL1R_01250 [Candidatus Latescibacterota bacterium]